MVTFPCFAVFCSNYVDVFKPLRIYLSVYCVILSVSGPLSLVDLTSMCRVHVDIRVYDIVFLVAKKSITICVRLKTGIIK